MQTACSVCPDVFPEVGAPFPGRETTSFGTTFKLGLAIFIAGQSMMVGLAINLTPPEPESLHFLQGLLLLAA